MYFLIRLLKFILLGVIGYILYKVLWKGESLSLFKAKKKQHPQQALEEMKKDPVCGTYLPENLAVKYKFSGKAYYFCSEECKQKFQQLQQQ